VTGRPNRRRSNKNKKPSAKSGEGKLFGDENWTVVKGRLRRLPGHPGKAKSLFKFVGEKIPYGFLDDVRKHFKGEGISADGVYIAHDSMGYPRYIGRGNIFSRLKMRRKQQILELSYFSFFVVEEKMHEREIETIMIRSAGPLLDFNSRKVRNNIQPGSVRDFEAGTKYIQRQYRKGRRPAEVVLD
jgi:hypothetical protein